MTASLSYLSMEAFYPSYKAQPINVNDQIWEQLQSKESRDAWSAGALLERTIRASRTSSIIGTEFLTEQTLVSAAGKHIKIWDISMSKTALVSTFPITKASITGYRSSQNKAYISAGKRILVWDFTSGCIVQKTKRIGASKIRTIDYEQSLIIGASCTKKLYQWDEKSGKRIASPIKLDSVVRTCLLDQEQIYISFMNSPMVAIFDQRKSSQIMALKNNQSPVTALEKGMEKLIVGTLDAKLHFWNRKAQEPLTIDTQAVRIDQLKLDQRSKLLFLGDAIGAGQAINIETFRQVSLWRTAKGYSITCLSPDADRMISGDHGGYLSIFRNHVIFSERLISL